MRTKRYNPSVTWMVCLIGTLCMMLLAAQTVSEFLIRDWGIAPATVYAAQLMLLAIGLTAILTFYRKPTLELVTSFKFACVLLIIITIFTILGTWIVQTNNRAEFQEIYGGWFKENGWWEGTHFRFHEKLHPNTQRELARLGLRPGVPIPPSLLKETPWSVKADLFEEHATFRRIGDGYDVAARAKLTDVYHAWWYSGLLVLVMVCASTAVLTRYRTSWRKLGFVLTHCSVAVILAGSLVGDYFGATKGYVLVHEGETRSAFVPVDRGQNMGAGIPTRYLAEPEVSPVEIQNLPFKLTLNKFDKPEYPPAYKLYYQVKERKVKDPKPDEEEYTWGKWHPAWVRGESPVYRDAADVHTGRTPLVGSDYSLIVRRYISKLDVEPKSIYRNASNEVKNPAVYVRYKAEASFYEQNDYMFHGGSWFSPDHQAMILFSWFDFIEAGEPFAQRMPKFQPMRGKLEVRLPDTDDPVSVPFVLGQEVPVGQSPYSIRVERYEPHFSMLGKNRFGSKSSFPENPAVRLQVFKTEADAKENLDPRGEGIWRFRKHPDDWFETRRRTPPLLLPIQVRLVESTHWESYKDVYVITGSNERVYLFQDGEVVDTQSIQWDKDLTFRKAAGRMALSNLIPHAVLNVDLKNLAEESSKETAPTMPYLFVDLFHNDSDELVSRAAMRGTLDPRKRAVRPMEDQVRLCFRTQDVMPEGFKSWVTIEENGSGKKYDTSVSMNYPLNVNGYVLYQSSYGAEQPAPGAPLTFHSIFQVVKDPGVEIVYLGFIGVVVGLILMLVIQPWLRNRAKTTANPEKPKLLPAAPGTNGPINTILMIFGGLLLLLQLWIILGTLSVPQHENNFFRSGEQSADLFQAMVVLSSCTALCYILNGFFIKNRALGWLCTGLLVATFAANTAYLAYGWDKSGHAPINTFHTASTLASWTVLLAYLLVELFSRARIVGGIATLAGMGMHFFALTKWESEYAPVPPSLKSAWFVPHVTVYLFAYALLTVGSLAALIYLISPRVKALTARNAYVFGNVQMTLDRSAYRVITFGFIFLTCGLFSGAWWAKGAWGDYWFWDPKETWGFISWLIFLIFLHLRYVRGWMGKKAMVFCVLGALAIVFTYFAMAELPSKTHSIHIYTGD